MRRVSRGVRRGVRAAHAEAVRYLRVETTGGVLLLAATAAGLVAANTPLSGPYTALRDTVVGPHLWHLDLPVGEWATSGLLTVFFLVAGLELKRELVVGDLRNVRRAMLPVSGAIGGMVVPAVVAFGVAYGAPGGASAWPVPVATDIAFALAVLAVAAPGLPTGVRLFLLSLAVVDDLGAITLIAVLFTETIAIWPLLLSALAVAVYWASQRMRVRFTPWYVLLGVVAWIALHSAGVHATIAGVAIALCTRVVSDDGEEHAPGEILEHRLQPFSAAVCVPLFAFFAAGVTLDGEALRAFATDRVAWAVIAGLTLGKTLGVLGGCALAVRLRLARLPRGLTWTDLAAVSVLTGCGFTVSLLIAELAFDEPQRARIKAAVLAGSLIAALCAAGVLLLRSRLSAERRPSP